MNDWSRLWPALQPIPTKANEPPNSCLRQEHTYAHMHEHAYMCAHLRKDRYNQKLEKFYVIFEEQDESLSEEEERKETREEEASN